MTLPTTKPIQKDTKSHTHRNSTVHTIDDMDEDSTIPVVPEVQWPNVAHLATGGLMQQSHIICEICRDAIKIVEVTLVTKHAWLELHKGAHYKWRVLLEAVNALQFDIENDDNGKKDKQYKALRNRILKDEKIVRNIGKWVCDLFLPQLENYDNIFI